MIKNLILKIKEKSSLADLDDQFIEKYINEYFKLNPKIREILENHPRPEKSKYYKLLIKKVRNELNRIYGVFWLDKKRNLLSHKSTRERSSIYPEIYKKIFKITGAPKTILDVSCGLNPLTYKYLKNIKFIVTELTKKDCEFLKEYFRKNKINAEVLQMDLFEKNIFPKADICFLFKILDLLPRKKSEEIITSIDCKYIIASFSLIDIHGRRMNYPLQGWFQRMLKRLNLRYELIKEKNEIFYVIKNNYSFTGPKGT